MSKWGGKRPGAGRPKGSKNKETKKKQMMREALQNRVEEELEPLLTSQLDMAKGVVVQKRVKTDDGHWVDKYYKRAPSTKAAKYLIDQAIGRASQQVEVEGSMTLVDVVGSLNDNDEQKEEETSEED